MKIDYFAHDRVYRLKRQRGYSGWDTPQQDDVNFEHILRLLHGIDIPSSPSGLELGCGNGNMTLRFSQAGWRMHGVGISPAAIAWAKENAQSLELDAEFHLADIVRGYKLPIEPVDAIIDGHCLHCIIGYDRAAFFAFAGMHVKKGGYLLVDTMCGDPWMDEAKRHFDRTTRCIVYDNIAARYLGRPDDILKEVADAGFMVLTSEMIEASQPDDQHTLLAIARRG